MSTIFADKFKNTSGGNNVRVNQLSGIDTAGSITIQGEGTATTNLQQGLVKVWVDVVTASSFGDSFNMASMTDHGSSDQQYFYSSIFANGAYGAAHLCGDTGGTTGSDSRCTEDPLPGNIRLRTTYSSNTAYEWPHQKYMYIGDLA